MFVSIVVLSNLSSICDIGATVSAPSSHGVAPCETVKASAEAQGQVQLEQAERLKRVEAELAQARAATAAPREEAAQLRGQAEALTAQHAELMRVIQDRDGERSAPKGGKKLGDQATVYILISIIIRYILW
jgi:hypothetical protein